MYGARPVPPQSGSGWSVLRHFDAFPKQREEAKEFFQSTMAGGVITLVAAALMTLLFVSELGIFMHTDTVTELLVDTSRGEKMDIHFDITLPHMPCSWVSVDAMDVSGELQLDVDHTVFRRRLSPEGLAIGEDSEHHVGPTGQPLPAALGGSNATAACGSCYGAEFEAGKCCNTCEEVREAYRRRGWAVRDTATVIQCAEDHYLEEIKASRGEGCRIYGALSINKVAGNLHLAPGKSYQAGHMHVHDTSPFVGEVFDFSHTIDNLAFGQEYPGMHNPLDGVDVHAVRDSHDRPVLGQHQYFLKVVPTEYHATRGAVIETNQFSVTEHFKPSGGMGQELTGIFFFYDLSPIKVTFIERRSSFLAFLTSTCAIVGGVFTISGIVDATVYHGQKMLRKKLEMGKQF
ncbi:hypothetical protein ACKKBG_A04140 [Auxenochlorella protothecoides x Auxenochlorella symbiontica]|uniref:Endoplasmic reticulum-Golgi intermediate compartment protein 3 n=1 Tax=Auxenochlorella protothecoides TaxID=3075 RepID=A0A1D2A414_AUXPR